LVKDVDVIPKNNMMKLSANFTLDELIKSQVATRKNISNNPSPQQIENLKALAINILQPIRTNFDKPMIISSGFRCAELCLEIGSSINSEHCAHEKSAAADFEIWSIDNKELAMWIKDNLEFNQLILEFYKSGDPNSGWIHCSYSTEHNKNQFLIAYKNEEGKTKYKPFEE
jgi:zinc D-Ala-D-Ala carboxypeptidase|tara:strand:- start:227 stop:739 length:513 start_codon:yes stop_codon:yes gene_type:complete